MPSPIAEYSVCSLDNYIVFGIVDPSKGDTRQNQYTTTDDLDYAKQISMTWAICGFNSWVVGLNYTVEGKPGLGVGVPTRPFVFTDLSSVQTVVPSVADVSPMTTPVIPPKGLSDGDFATWLTDTSSMKSNFMPPSAPAIADGSFEELSVGEKEFQYRPEGSPWTFEGGTGISGNGSPFTAGNPNAPDRSQVGFIQGGGSISQQVTFSVAGTYSVSFQAAQRGNNGTSVQDFEVRVDEMLIGTFKPSSTEYESLVTDKFASSGSHTISFIGLNTKGGDNSVFIDNVALVPSPSVDGS